MTLHAIQATSMRVDRPPTRQEERIAISSWLMSLMVVCSLAMLPPATRAQASVEQLLGLAGASSSEAESVSVFK